MCAVTKVANIRSATDLNTFKSLAPGYPLNLFIVTCLHTFRACLHGGGEPQVGEVTCGGSPHLSCKHDQINMRDYMDRRVTSPTWGPPSPCKQALGLLLSIRSDFT